MKLHPKFFQLSVLAVLGVGVVSALSLGSNQRLQGQTGSECLRAVSQGGTCNTAAGETPTPGFLYDQNGACAAEGGCSCYTSAVCDCGNGINGLCFAGTCSMCDNPGGTGGNTATTGGDNGDTGADGGEPECVDDGDCVSQNLCEVGHCFNGECDFDAKDCNDNDECTVDTCDPAQGCLYNQDPACKNIPPPNNCPPGFTEITRSVDGQMTKVCVPDVDFCHECEDACRDQYPPPSDVYDECRHSCNYEYNDYDPETGTGDSCSNLCEQGDGTNPINADLCGDAATCCVYGCVGPDEDGDYGCSRPDLSTGGSGGTGGSTGGAGGVTGGDSGGPGGGNTGGSGGSGDTGDTGSDTGGGSSAGSSASNSSVSSCYQQDDPELNEQYKNHNLSNACNICDQDCEYACMCDFGYPQRLIDENGNVIPEEEDDWETAQIVCRNQCREERSASFASTASTNSNSSTANSTQSVASVASSVASKTSVINSSAASAISTIPGPLVCIPEFEQLYCLRLQSTIQLTIDPDAIVPLDCFYDQFCTSCNSGGGVGRFKQSCFKTCFTPICGNSGVRLDAELQECDANECEEPPPPPSCTSDSDCPEKTCSSCGYNEEKKMCTQDCENSICLNGKCTTVIQPPESCDGECDDNGCDQDDVPTCESGEFAYCCENSSWECVPEGTSDIVADTLLCANNNECPFGFGCVDAGTCTGLTGGSCNNGAGVCCVSVTGSSASSFPSSVASSKLSSSSKSTSSFVFSLSSSKSSSSLSSSSKSSLAQVSSKVSIASSAISIAASFSFESSGLSISSDTSAIAFSSQVSDAGSIASGGAQSSSVSLTLSIASEASESSAVSISSDPTGKAFCGNGTIERGEQCDDANDINDDGCNNACRVNKTDGDPLAYCGNGTLEVGEECDDGNVESNDECSAVCTKKSLSLRCGNGIVEQGEQCDDGNFFGGDGCSPFCKRVTNDDNGDGDNDDGTPNNFFDEDDDGDGDEDDGIPQNQQDDDNGDGDNDDGVPGNDRTTLVASASVCGNGQLESGEECDDSNRRDNDGCSSTCKLEIGVCGDGVVQTLLGEQCEQRTHSALLPYGCVRCRFVSKTCGDGTVDPGEECDDGTQNSLSPNANCRPDCRFGACGDGVLDSDEQCDDANRVNGDGCDRNCREEKGGVAPAPSQVAGDITQNQQLFQPSNVLGSVTTQYLNQPGFPQFPTSTVVPYQLPLAQLQPLVQGQAPVGDTGPAAVAVIGAGAAAGFSYMRRKK